MRLLSLRDSDQRERLIGRTKGGLTTKLHAVTDAKRRPLKSFMTAGQVSDYTGTAAPLGGLPEAEWLIEDRGYDADWFRSAFKTKVYVHASPVGSHAAKLSATTGGAIADATASRSCSVASKTGAESQPAMTGVPKPSYPPSHSPQPSWSGFEDQ